MYSDSFGDGEEIKPYNPIRIVEWILCSICLILAIYILLKIHSVHIILKSIFLLVAASYFFITLADIIVTSLLKPMLWTTWILFSIMGALTFFLCSGFLIIRLRPFGFTLYTATLVANTVTGCIFLLEVIHMASWLTDEDDSVESLKSIPVSISSQTPTETLPSPSPDTKQEDKANQLGNYLQRMGNNKIIQYPSDAILVQNKNICVKDTCPKKCTAVEVPSHGGTFHVSRDVAPILSPTPLRSIRSSFSTCNTPLNSPRNNYKYNNLHTRNCQNRCQNNIEEATVIKSNTVSTSTPTKLKINQAIIHTSNVPSANNLAHEENIDVSGLYHSSSLSVHSNISDITPAVQRYYACTYCGKVHRSDAAEQFTSCGDPNNKYKFQILPTLHEDSSYSSIEEPTKDYTSCPHPSSTTSSNSDKLSPCSEGAVNPTSYRMYKPQITCNQIYPVDKPLSSRGRLENTKREDFTKTGDSQQCCSNKRNIFMANTEDNLRKPRRIADQEGQAIFNFEPQYKTKQIQTQPYQIQSKNDYSSTSNDYNSVLSIYQHDYGEPITSSKLNNTVANVIFDDCLGKGEGLEVHFMDSDVEKLTVLPGAADYSPGNEASTEKHAVKHPQNQQITVIDISDEKSDRPVRSLQDPTIVRRKRRSQLQRKSRNCTVM